MYAVLYAYTPEIFATKDRGTGNALTACSNRIFGIMGKRKQTVSVLDQEHRLTMLIAPIVAMFADLETPAPVYVSGSLFIVAACIVCILPYESRGKASL